MDALKKERMSNKKFMKFQLHVYRIISRKLYGYELIISISQQLCFRTLLDLSAGKYSLKWEMRV